MPEIRRLHEAVLTEAEINNAVKALIQWFKSQEILVGDSLQIMAKAISLGIIQIARGNEILTGQFKDAVHRDLDDVVEKLRVEFPKHFPNGLPHGD